MHNNFNIEKIVFILRELYKKNSSSTSAFNIVSHSKFDFDETEHYLFNRVWYGYDVTIHTEFEVYSDHHYVIKELELLIQNDLKKITTLSIDHVKILPDYEKLEIINAEIRPVLTDWEEINQAQIQLIDQLRKSENSIDLQNVGNTSRTILQKLCKIVYKKEDHSPSDARIDVSEGKFKNQLHSYIKAELSGESNRELRQFAEASVTLVEKAIDLANTVTHKLTADKIIAEVCVIGTISAINIIKSIEK